jgi:hypothetical protein
MRNLAFSLLVVATAAHAETDASGPTDNEPLKGNVLVWHDAALFTAPADDASTVHLTALGGARTDKIGHVVPMHVVATHGAFVEVEMVDGPGCTWTSLSSNDDIAKLHLFVRRSDLSQVLTKSFDKTFADGTKISLRPGVAVVPTSTGAYALSVRGHEVVAEIPSASVGYAYTPDAKKASSMSLRDSALDASAKATLGDHPVALGGLRVGGVEARGDGALASIEDRCVSLTVAVAKSAIKTVDEDDDNIAGGSGFGVLGMRETDFLPALTPLATPAGRQIAYAAKPIYVVAAAHGKNVCFDRRLRLESVSASAPAVEPSDDSHLRLCAPATKIAHERIRTASSANASTIR